MICSRQSEDPGRPFLEILFLKAQIALLSLIMIWFARFSNSPLNVKRLLSVFDIPDVLR